MDSIDTSEFRRIQGWVKLLLVARRMTVSDLSKVAGLKQPDVARSLNASSAWNLDRLWVYAEVIGLPPSALLDPRETEEEAVSILAEHGLPFVPRELCWDTKGRRAPRDLMWRLRRIVKNFPAIGRDPATVRQILANADALRLQDHPTVEPVARALLQ